MKTIIAGLAIILFAANAQASTYREKRELNMEAEGIQALDISCGAGIMFGSGEKNNNTGKSITHINKRRNVDMRMMTHCKWGR